MSNINFVWVNAKENAFEDARYVRRNVFCIEQGYSIIGEFDDADNVSMHIIGYDEKLKPVCAARIFKDGENTYHVGRVAVLKEKRGYGLGYEMMQEILIKAANIGAEKLILNAQADKYKFYEKSGFSLTGKKMLDEGQPHVEMILDINKCCS